MNIISSKTIKEVTFDSKKERDRTVEIMLGMGWQVTSQVKLNIGTIQNPNFVDYACFILEDK